MNNPEINLEVVRTTKSKFFMINSKQIHNLLQVQTRFNDWIKRKTKAFGFEEGLDYTKIPGGNKLGRKSAIVILSLDAAIAIVSSYDTVFSRILVKELIKLRPYRCRINTDN